MISSFITNPDLPKNQSMGHLFSNEDTSCRNGDCGQNWAGHQEDPKPCEVERPFGYGHAMLRDDPDYVRVVKTHCRHGHEFTEDNTRYSPDGRKRFCKICQGKRNEKETLRRQAANASKVTVPMDATHCKHGHEFTEENTRLAPDKKRRYCRECAAQRNEDVRVRRHAAKEDR